MPCGVCLDEDTCVALDTTHEPDIADLQELLESAHMTRAMLITGKPKDAKKSIKGQQHTEPEVEEEPNPYDNVNGVVVSVKGTGSFAGLTVQGETVASAEAGVKISCCGVDMSVNDFAKFGGAKTKEAAKRAVHVEAKEVGSLSRT